MMADRKVRWTVDSSVVSFSNCTLFKFDLEGDGIGMKQFGTCCYRENNLLQDVKISCHVGVFYSLHNLLNCTFVIHLFSLNRIILNMII